MSDRAAYIAVDVGSDRVRVATADRARPEDARTVRLGHRADAASSAVFVVEDGMVHGDAADQRSVGEPERVLRGYTSRVGDSVPLAAAGRTLRPEDVLASVVEWAVTGAAETQAAGVADVTTVVPATWGPHRRAQLSRALEARGLPARLLAGPEAVAHATGVSGTIAVYDLGADSCDLAVVRVSADGVEVRGAVTIDELGGADFDDAITSLIAEHVPAARSAAPLAAAALRRAATAAKEALSFDAETVVPVLAPGAEHLVRLVRGEFEALIEDDLLRTVRALQNLLDELGVAAADVDALVLVGGSSRIPRVAQLLSEHLPIPLRVDADPQTVAVRGAARAAAARTDDDAPRDAPEAATPDAVDTAPVRRGRLRRGWDALLRALTPPVTLERSTAAAGTPVDAREGPPTPPTASRTLVIPQGAFGAPPTSPPPSPAGAPAPARGPRVGV